MLRDTAPALVCMKIALRKGLLQGKQKRTSVLAQESCTSLPLYILASYRSPPFWTIYAVPLLEVK